MHRGFVTNIGNMSTLFPFNILLSIDKSHIAFIVIFYCLISYQNIKLYSQEKVSVLV